MAKWALIVILSVAGLPVCAAPPGQSNSAASDSTARVGSAHPLTTDDLESFFSGLMPYALHSSDIAGVSISIVRDGHTIFAKGYGLADLKDETPVVADSTIFRIGSVSKLFTWTAVMQLVAAGKIDLNRDVNAYLDFKIPDKYGQPITMRDLMTMTPGFEEVLRDLIPEKLYPMRQYLIDNIPARIFPPGKVVAYSNYGATLAGYIVQRISGEPFNQYVEEHIFKPLGMTDSTFAQPLPDSMRPHMASGYVTTADREAGDFELVEAAPAGSMSSTATDMAKFMIAELNNGQFRGARILPPDAIKRMHTQHYAPAPGMNGYALGFYEESRNGLRIIGHGGDTNLFHSDLHLIPSANVGFFITFNSAGSHGASAKARMALFQKFLDRYFPWSAPAEQTVPNPEKDAERVAGWYAATRREESAMRLFFLLNQTPVRALPNGMITVGLLSRFSLGNTPTRWREVGPLYYREVGGQAHIKFVTDKDGEIQYWTSDAMPPVEVFQPRHGLMQFGVMKPMVQAAMVVLVLTLLIWLGAWLVRRRFRTPLELEPRQYWLRLASRLGTLLLLAVVGVWLWIAVLLGSGVFEIGTPLMTAYVLGIFGILGGIAIVIEGVLRVARGPGGLFVRCGETLLVLSAVYGIWVILALGLANFHMSF